jgi:hypothetical protein
VQKQSIVRQYYPSAKIGLVVSPISFSGKNDPIDLSRPHPSWPEKLRQFDEKSSQATFGDALVIHPYVLPALSSNDSSEIQFLKCYLESNDRFNQKFPIAINYLRSIGKGKPIWLTEWGLSVPEAQRNDFFNEYKTSVYHALFVASALVSITLEDVVEIANYHNASDLWQTAGDETKLTAVGVVIEMLTEVAKSNDFVCQVLLEAIETGLEKPMGIKSIAFSSSTVFDLVIINEKQTPYRIRHIDLGSFPYARMAIDSLSITDRSKKDFQDDRFILMKDDATGVEIKPFSITHIKITKAS